MTAPIETFTTLAETTTTADPGSGGTSLAVTTRTPFPQATGAGAAGQFYILVQNSETDKTNREIMLVTAGQGTGAGSFTVVRGQGGTTGVAHASSSYVAQVLTAEALRRWVPEFVTQPRHHKGVCWCYPPECCGGSAILTTLVPYLVKCWVPSDITIANVALQIQNGASGLVSGSNRVGVYDSSGTLLSQSADISAWGTSYQTFALAASQNIVGGAGVFVWLAVMSSATTPISPGRAFGGLSSLANAGLAAADGYRSGNLAAVSSGTGLPASFSPSSQLSLQSAPPWLMGT
jgi:hypothetical protein